MEYVITCSVPFSQDASGYIACTGTIQSLANNGLTIEDAQELSGKAIWLFAIIFGVLALKKALS